MACQAGIFETIRLNNGTFLLLREHTRRLVHACKTLYGVNCAAELSEVLCLCTKIFSTGEFAVKIAWSPKAGLTWHVFPLPASIASLDVHLAAQPIGNSQLTYSYKWIDRSHYPHPLSPHQDWLLYDDEGYCTEFTRGNLAYFLHRQWYTPPNCRKLLPGTLRDYLLRIGLLEQRQLHLSTLLNGYIPLVFFNSLRGFIPARLSVTN